MTLYVLDESGAPVAEPDTTAWSRWFATADRQVARDELGGATVSTVFLGLDHGFGQTPPVLWETMIFGGPHGGYQERYCSREAALLGHVEAVRLAGSET